MVLTIVNSSIWPIDRILTGTITLTRSVPGSNGSKGVFYIAQSSSPEASSSDTV